MSYNDSRKNKRYKRKKKYRINKPRFIFAIIVALTLVWASFKLVLSASNLISQKRSGLTAYSSDTIDEKDEKTNKNDEKDSESSGAESISVLASGDILYQSTMVNAGYNSATEKYDFTDHYGRIRDLISDCDLAITNLVGIIADKDESFSYGSLIILPEEVTTALRYAGFDAIATGNNHCLDNGAKGIENTIDAINFNNMKHFGTKKLIGEELPIIDVKGIKIGLLSYAESFNGLEKILPEDKRYMISRLDEDQIKKDLSLLKSRGADLSIVYLNWGKEYSLSPDDAQIKTAHNLIESGADLVLGTSTNVLQKMEIVNKDDKDKFIIYSMGNAISNLREETIQNKFAEVGVFLKFEIEKKDGDTVIKKLTTYPTWTNSYTDINGNKKFELLNTQDFVEGGKYRDTVNESTLNRIIEARDLAIKVLNGEL
ncbi:MAG: CapA family protein [Tissierellia bacterium]|nr:CapA family protein [Tissierellia bacterium]